MYYNKRTLLSNLSLSALVWVLVTATVSSENRESTPTFELNLNHRNRSSYRL